MNRDYELVSQKLDSTHNVLVLKQIGEDTFFDEMANDHRRKDEAASLRRSLIRLSTYGISWGLDSESIKILKGIRADILLCEVKVKRKTYRIMAYLHDKRRGPFVLLTDFEGHKQRAAGGIPKQVMEKGERLALIAKGLLEQEGY